MEKRKSVDVGINSPLSDKLFSSNNQHDTQQSYPCEPTHPSGFYAQKYTIVAESMSEKAKIAECLVKIAE